MLRPYKVSQQIAPAIDPRPHKLRRGCKGSRQALQLRSRAKALMQVPLPFLLTCLALNQTWLWPRGGQVCWQAPQLQPHPQHGHRDTTLFAGSAYQRAGSLRPAA